MKFRLLNLAAECASKALNFVGFCARLCRVAASFKILMFRLFAARLCDQILNLRRLLVAVFPRDLNFKFNRKVEILKRQNLDLAQHRSVSKI